MNEQRIPSGDTTVIEWADVRFDDGKHTGVRVLRGTYVIEIKRDGRTRTLDIRTCTPIDLVKK